MVYSASNITQTAFPASGKVMGVSGSSVINGREETASAESSFMDFVLARVTSLQHNSNEINTIVNTTTTVTNQTPSLPTSDMALLQIAQFLAPFEQGETAQSINLEDLPQDLQLALKELSTAILDIADNSELNLSEQQVLSLTMLSQSLPDAIGPTDTDVEMITVEINGVELNIPKEVAQYLDLDNINTHDNATILSAIASQLENFTALAAHKKNDNRDEVTTEVTGIVTEENKPADKNSSNSIAAVLNALEPGDGDDNAMTDANKDDRDDDTDTVIAVGQELPTQPNNPEKIATGKNPAEMASIKQVAPTPMDGELSDDDLGNTPTEDDIEIIANDGNNKTSGKHDSTASAPKGNSFANTLNSQQQAMQNSTTATANITDTLDGTNDLSEQLVKSADALIQSDNTKALNGLKTSTTLSQANTTAAQQVSLHVFKAATKGDTRITVRLHPEELGKVDVKLEMTRDGKAKATVIADNSDTLNMLAKDAAQLQKALNDAGLNTQSGDLSFQLNSGNDNQASNKNGNGNAGQNQQTSMDDVIVSTQYDDSFIGEYSVNYKV